MTVKADKHRIKERLNQSNSKNRWIKFEKIERSGSLDSAHNRSLQFSTRSLYTKCVRRKTNPMQHCVGSPGIPRIRQPQEVHGHSGDSEYSQVSLQIAWMTKFPDMRYSTQLALGVNIPASAPLQCPIQRCDIRCIRAHCFCNMRE